MLMRAKNREDSTIKMDGKTITREEVKTEAKIINKLAVIKNGSRFPKNSSQQNKQRLET